MERDRRTQPPEDILNAVAPAEPAGRNPNAPWPAPQAVLWDMDGTLIDSEQHWIAVETALAQAHGRTWTETDALSLIGNDLILTAHILRTRLDLPLSEEQILDHLLREVTARVSADVPWRPGARELLAEVRSAGVPCALVTMSYTVFVDAVVGALPHGTFDAVVTGDQVERGKPDPQAYRTAVERLGVEAARCVALEDSPPGVRSAHGAGTRVVGVRFLAELPDEPWLTCVDSLADLDLADLSALAAGQDLPAR